MDNVYVNIERSVTLQCRAVGVPKPSVIWLKNGKEINEFLEKKAIVILPDDSLLFQSKIFKLLISCYNYFLDVDIDDQGEYTCVAKNNFGEQRKHTTLIITGLGN